jgi:hypothetical protein
LGANDYEEWLNAGMALHTSGRRYKKAKKDLIATLRANSLFSSF